MEQEPLETAGDKKGSDNMFKAKSPMNGKRKFPTIKRDGAKQGNASPLNKFGGRGGA